MAQNLEELLSELTSGDETRAEAAVEHLASLQSKALLETLSGWLASPDAETRWWAARALSALDDARVPTLLTQALSDADPDVRRCAALGLRSHPAPQAIPQLVTMLGEADGLAARLAGDALAAIGAEAVPPLLEALQNGNRTARLAAARALAFVQDKRSIPALFNALDEDSALLEYWAGEGLERMGVGMAFFTPE